MGPCAIFRPAPSPFSSPTSRARRGCCTSSVTGTPACWPSIGVRCAGWSPAQAAGERAGPASLRDLGEPRLKVLPGHERTYQLGDDEFPPPKSLNTTNLPVASKPLVGRQPELEELTAMLADSERLVTLTGPG